MVNSKIKKYICCDCDRLIRCPHNDKSGKPLCRLCYRKRQHKKGKLIGGWSASMGRGLMTIEEAQKKVRKVSSTTKNGKYYQGFIGLPRCYIGKKVRVIVVEDDKDFKEKFCDLCGDTTHYHGECKK